MDSASVLTVRQFLHLWCLPLCRIQWRDRLLPVWSFLTSASCLSQMTCKYCTAVFTVSFRRWQHWHRTHHSALCYCPRDFWINNTCVHCMRVLLLHKLRSFLQVNLCLADCHMILRLHLFLNSVKPVDTCPDTFYPPWSNTALPGLSLPFTTCLPCSISLHRRTLQHFTQSASSLRSARSNRLNLLLLTTKLTGSSPNNICISFPFLSV